MGAGIKATQDGAQDGRDRWSLEQFADLVRRHQSAVCAVAYGVTGDRALSEDIAQDTFVAAWRGLSTLREPSRIAPWLRGIARNLAHKARRKRATVEELDELDAGDDLARDAVARDEARGVWVAMRALPARYREVLVLYYWEDQSARQVAASLGITEATAMQRLSRGRARLRDEVQRRVDRTLRRARPGAALTAAILAAIAARTGTASAAAAGTHAGPLAGMSRRTLCKAGAALGALGVLGVGTSRVRLRRRRGGSHRSPAAAETPPPGPRAAVPGDRSGPSQTATPASNPEIRGDEINPGGHHVALLTSGGEPARWANRLLPALSTCFIDELVDHPCRIDVEVRDGKITAATVAPFDGASRRVVVRTLQEVPAALPPPELFDWIAAGQQITTVLDAPELSERDQAMPLGDLIALCAKACLAGRPVAGPDGLRPLEFQWKQEVVQRVDWQAYLDLDVASGAGCGPPRAPATIVSFLDIADPRGFGGMVVAALSEVVARYPRDVRIVIKLCPFPDPVHERAAEAVYAAHAQNAFWPMLERVAAHRWHLAPDDLVEHASALGLDRARLRADLDRHAFRDAIEIDREQMAAMNIDALPSALVNTTRIHGALPVTDYLRAVDIALRSAGAHDAR